jgi:general secretion pathway protein D
MVVLVKKSRSLQTLKRAGVCFGLTFALAGSAVSLSAQSVDENFRTYRDAIQAKDAKNYAEALRLFNELHRLEPDNIGYQVEVDEIKKLMESSPVAPKVEAAVVAEVAPVQAPVQVAVVEEEESPWGATTATEVVAAEPAAPVDAPQVVVEDVATADESNGQQVVAEAAVVAAPAADEDPIEAILRMQKQADLARTAQARALYERGLALYDDGMYNEAQALFAQAKESVPQNAENQRLVRDIDRSLKESILDMATEYAENGNFAPAKAELNRYVTTFGNDSAVTRAQRAVAAMEGNPRYRDINRISPGFIDNKEKVQNLLINGEAMYQAGDWEGAMNAFKEAQKLDPYNSAAVFYIGRIARNRTTSQNRTSTRDELLDQIDKVWMRPTVFESSESSEQVDQLARDAKRDRIRKKLESIAFPVNFRGVRLSQIVETLAELSAERDETDDPIKGVNIIFVPPADGSDPEISINLRDLNLSRVLAYIAEISNFEVEIREDTVAIIKSQDNNNRLLQTEVFPVDNSIIMRMTGNAGSGAASSASVSSDPFADVSSSSPSVGGMDDLSSQIKTFFIRAGIPFDVPGSDLVYDNGGSLIVTNTTRNVERVEQLLRRYDVANMVEVETKFIEVTASDMDEIGFDWNISRFPKAGGGYDEVYRSGNRTLAQAFTNSSAPSSVIVDGNIVDSVVPPSIPLTVDLGAGVNPLATISSVMGQFDANLLIRAISRKSGTDLMSAPKITMVSGKEATITIAQEFPYPEDYDAPTVEVGRGGSGGSDTSTGTGAPAVAITAGTPGRFLTRNVGVTLKVTPTVDAARNRISMKLQPEIVEFEGFVEYGGRNIALLGDQQLIAPTGFFQPIFSVRKIDTDVTLWDGATLVMGGLMREEVIRVKDKVPVLGDIPLLGRLFRSEAESSQKRNLLIFVTGNLIGDGGAPLRQSYRGLERNSQFSNPILLTPGVEIYRGRQ